MEAVNRTCWKCGGTRAIIEGRDGGRYACAVCKGNGVISDNRARRLYEVELPDRFAHGQLSEAAYEQQRSICKAIMDGMPTPKFEDPILLVATKLQECADLLLKR